MKATYYIPKQPDSVPLIDEEKQIVTLIIDGETIDISISLFNKIYKEAEQKENNTSFNPYIFSLDDSSPQNIMNSLKKAVRDLKSMGLPKEALIQSMDAILNERGMAPAYNEAKKIIEDIFNED